MEEQAATSQRRAGSSTVMGILAVGVGKWLKNCLPISRVRRIYWARSGGCSNQWSTAAWAKSMRRPALAKKQPLTLEQAIKQAEEYSADEGKLFMLVERAARKADRYSEFLHDSRESLHTLFRLIRARLAGAYSAPASTILMAIAAVIYFLDPFDLIPDSVPVLGFLDDALVIAYVMNANLGEIRRFKKWEGT